MKNNQAKQLAALITDIVTKKGTCFAGFVYNGKRRNVTLGAKLSNRVSGVGNWGATSSKGCIVEHRGSLYLQGIPNNEDNAPVVKRFKLNQVENFVVG